MKNKDLKRRILDVSYRYKLSHLGSCLTAVDIIEEIYQVKMPWERFVLSNGHAGLALYCVIEKHGGRNAEDIFNHHGVHPDRCLPCGLDCSTGSLGQGLPVAVGMALADRDKNVYCLVSDGEMAEGSIFEALQIKYNQGLSNLKIYLNWNGWAAYGSIHLDPKLADFGVDIRLTEVEQLPFLKGQDAHYYVMKDEDYKRAQNLLR